MPLAFSAVLSFVEKQHRGRAITGAKDQWRGQLCARGLIRYFTNPPEASRTVVDEWYDGHPIMSGRRTCDNAGG
jgi:hypothetical protein